ncbi:mRNA binding protein puf3 [Pseudocyphellaria aurata]|nr:mRNA binding protein puf3 [Pseudocyphellaria aurata]
MTSTARNRFGNVGSGSSAVNGEQSRPLHGSSFGPGFGPSGSWGSGGIWSNTAIGSGLKNGSVDNGRIQEFAGSPGNAETITGSGSLLPSSESDSWGGHQASQWKADSTSPTLSSSHTNNSSSPMRRQSSNQLFPPTLSKPTARPTTYPTFSPVAQTIPDSFVASNFLDQAQRARSSRQNSDEENRYAGKALNPSGSDMGFQVAPGRHNILPGYNSSAASRSGSLPPSRNGVDRFGDDSVNTQYAHLGASTSTSHRQNYTPSIMRSSRPNQNCASPTQVFAGFNRMNLDWENEDYYFAPQKAPANANNTSTHHYSHQLASNDLGESRSGAENQNPVGHDGFHHPSQYRVMPPGTIYAHSPSNSDARRNQLGPFYSSGQILSGMQHRVAKSGVHVNGVPHGDAAPLDRNQRGPQPNSSQFPSPFPHSYVPPAYLHDLLYDPRIPKRPREHDVGQHVRSVLLEEFRTSGKTNKRYELKDIYNHIVEFSGDQHGSRFIQQKLETANSDEKDQVFREIHPNSLQLMTDVFGNYVIQKFFEHGNQGQKKILASQMKNHILTLSLQMYGCRVVQKALEHILTDQQALLVKELEHHVLKCVKDQNGNHVVQKAIERVPAEHIQFIINAFSGQVHGLATHPYGCRVIQRMLEHCEEPTRSAVLQELHACASLLINDQYGNYVTQHVIEHGREEDRAKVITLITGNLVNFSKHKFASNVVEKSIEFGTADQRGKIVSTLTVLNDKGESPLQALIRDQYGNYVIQKLLNQLKDAEWDQFVELIKPQLALLKRFSCGKQITAIEKIVYGNPVPVHNNPALYPPIDISAAPTPPLLTSDAPSPQSISLPSTNASSLDGLAGSRKSSASNTLEVMTPTST